MNLNASRFNSRTSSDMKLLLTLALAGIITSLAVADPAPNFQLMDRNNHKVTLDSLRGKVVYLDFWASWCVPCKQSFPWMSALRAQYGEDKLAVVAVNLDKKRGPVLDFLDKNPATFTIVFDPDGKVAESYQVKGMPSTYLIDKDGNIQHTHIGFRDGDKAELSTKIEELLAK
jgi:cytochrome c biogenesis protein CcmG, thiol:disulfide interchange protein DsbE